MVTGGALLGGFGALIYVATVDAVPFDRSLSLEYLTLSQVVDQFSIP
jgi:hypothetical protein